MKPIKLTAIISPEGDGFESLCPELDIASQGQSIDEARQNLLGAVKGFLEVASQSEIDSRLNSARYVENLGKTKSGETEEPLVLDYAHPALGRREPLWFRILVIFGCLLGIGIIIATIAYRIFVG